MSTPTATTIIATALQIGAAAAPEIPAIVGLFQLASTLLTQGREPTSEEAQQLQSSVDTAQQEAQTALAAAAQAQAAAGTLSAAKAALSAVPAV